MRSLIMKPQPEPEITIPPLYHKISSIVYNRKQWALPVMYLLQTHSFLVETLTGL
jgi:hypothetical protein